MGIDWPRLIRALLGQPEPVPDEPKPTKAVQVTGQQVFEVIEKVVPQAAHVYLSDNIYWLCSREDVDTFLKFDDTNRAKYVTEQHDCDDFSYRLMGQLSDQVWSGIAFGIVWTDVHALNCFIDENFKLWFVEPQTGAVKDKLDDWQGKEVLLVVM
jgi:hypothetical protein